MWFLFGIKNIFWKCQWDRDKRKNPFFSSSRENKLLWPHLLKRRTVSWDRAGARGVARRWSEMSPRSESVVVSTMDFWGFPFWNVMLVKKKKRCVSITHYLQSVYSVFLKEFIDYKAVISLVWNHFYGDSSEDAEKSNPLQHLMEHLLVQHCSFCWHGSQTKCYKTQLTACESCTQQAK